MVTIVDKRLTGFELADVEICTNGINLDFYVEEKIRDNISKRIPMSVGLSYDDIAKIANAIKANVEL